MSTPKEGVYHMERIAGTVDEYREAAGISRNAAYEAARRGDIKTIRVGKRILVPKSEFDKLRG